QEWDDADIWLQFGAVSYYVEVFVNGVLVGTHEGLWTGFEFDVTHAIRIGETNQLEVRVIKPGYKGDRFPYRDVLVGFLPYVFDTFGGIWQDVTLVAQRVSDIHLEIVFPHLHDNTVEVICSYFPDAVGQTLVATLVDADDQIVTQVRESIIHLGN